MKTRTLPASFVFFGNLTLLGTILGTVLPVHQAQAKYFKTSAASCQPLDLRKNFSMPIRDQGGVSWCYAHSAADYLQYTFQIQEQISATDIAINYSQSSTSKLVNFIRRIMNPATRLAPPQTGFVKSAIKKILPQGYCPEAALPSDAWTRIDPDTQKSSKLLLLQSILDTYSLQAGIHLKKYLEPSAMPYYFTFKHIDRNQFFEILKNSSRKSLLNRLRAKACAGERKPFPKRSIGLDFRFRGLYTFQRMNHSFNHGMPVSVDFMSTVLNDVNATKFDINELHTVLLYGRKYDSTANQCSYLMRNSWGNSCKGYDPKLNCENGYFWIPENTLYQSMMSQLLIHP